MLNSLLWTIEIRKVKENFGLPSADSFTVLSVPLRSAPNLQGA